MAVNSQEAEINFLTFLHKFAQKFQLTELGNAFRKESSDFNYIRRRYTQVAIRGFIKSMKSHLSELEDLANDYLQFELNKLLDQFCGNNEHFCTILNDFKMFLEAFSIKPSSVELLPNDDNHDIDILAIFRIQKRISSFGKYAKWIAEFKFDSMAREEMASERRKFNLFITKFIFWDAKFAYIHHFLQMNYLLSQSYKLKTSLMAILYFPALIFVLRFAKIFSY